MRTFNKTIAAAGIAAATSVLTFAGMGTAHAADGYQYFANGDFESATDTTTLQSLGDTTDFTLAQPVQAHYSDAGSGLTMYDPGKYIIGTNPNAYHDRWVDWSNKTPNKMLFVNGFTSGHQKVLSQTIHPEQCTTPGSMITFEFTAHAANIVPLSEATDSGAKISVTASADGGQTETQIGQTQDLTSNDPSNLVDIVGAVPAAPNLLITIWNDGTAYSGNDFAIDDISIVQRGTCQPPCEPTVKGVWFNYTGKYTGTTPPALDDPKWHALPATPGGEHSLALRGINKPYNPGADKGKGDWFVWKDLGTTCPVR
jgi:hypothetical protein